MPAEQRPFEVPHLACAMTQDEFKLVFSVAFVSYSDLFSGAYPLDSFATPGQEDAATTYEETWKRAIRYLAFDHGFMFAALQPREDGRIFAQQIESGNSWYLLALRGGTGPNLISAFETAMRIASERIPTLDLEPLRAALAQVRMDTVAIRAMDKLPEVIH